MTRQSIQRQATENRTVTGLRFTTPSGQPLTDIQSHLGLLGGPLEVMHATAHFLRQADQQQLPVILLGGQQDAAFLDLPDLLELNAVRTVALPPVLPGTSPDRLRESLTEAMQTFRTLLGHGPQLLVTGRHLGGHWPFVLGRLPMYAQQGGMVISDVRHQLATPLPQVFKNFLVWPEGQERMTRAVERWQRHQVSRPYTVQADLDGQAALWSAR